MPNVKSTKKFAGVYFSESKTRKWRGRNDKCYYVSFKESETGKLRWERCGWISEGWTPEAAQRKRHEVMEKDRAGVYKPKQARRAEQLTFGELMEERYLKWADENKKHAKDDRSRYEFWLKKRLAKKTLKGISPMDLERIKKDMRDAGKSDATVRHALCVVRQAFNKAVLWRLYDGTNPCKAITFPHPNNARQRFLSRDEAALLLKTLRERSPQVDRVAVFSLYGGLRLGEVLGLTWGNLDRTHGIINVLDTKNKEARAVFITEPIAQALDEMPPGAPDELLFQTHHGRPVGWLSKTFGRVVDELGMNEGVSDRRERVTFHTLRHTYASWAVMAGAPLYVVGKGLGHKSPVMTQRYSHLSPESHRAASEAVAGASTAEPLKATDEGGS